MNICAKDGCHNMAALHQKFCSAACSPLAYLNSSRGKFKENAKDYESVLRKYLAEGKSLRQCSRDEGIGYDTAWRYCKELGIHFPNGRINSIYAKDGI